MRDHYDTLGVSQDASQEDIKRAYHILAHQFHPDKEYGSEKRFREISDAFLVLSDERRKEEYDSEKLWKKKIPIPSLKRVSPGVDFANDTEPVSNTTWAATVAALIFIGVISLVIFASGKGNPSSSSESTTNAVTSIASTSHNSTTLSQTSGESSSKQYPAIFDASGKLTANFIAAVEPNVVEINCYSYDNSVESSGSGVSYFYSLSGAAKQNMIFTNYHVYTGAIVAGQTPTCYAVFPEPPNFGYNGHYGDYQLNLSAWHYNPSTYEDAALFTLGTPVSSGLPSIPVINDVSKEFGLATGQIECSESDASVGDSITIFGYPSSGNLLGISETVTEGIISGILPGPIYKTNAGIDHGNSGGVAILNKSGCSLGIPTLGQSGLTSGIGYIQSYILAKQAVVQGS